jgi:hypothetical protein
MSKAVCDHRMCHLSCYLEGGEHTIGCLNCFVMTNACTLSSCFVYSEVESKSALETDSSDLDSSVEEVEDAVTDNSFIGSGLESN